MIMEFFQVINILSGLLTPSKLPLLIGILLLLEGRWTKDNSPLALWGKVTPIRAVKTLGYFLPTGFPRRVAPELLPSRDRYQHMPPWQPRSRDLVRL